MLRTRPQRRGTLAVKRRHLIGAVGTSALLAACGKENTSGPAKPGATAQPVSIEAIAAEGTGFNVGSTMSARVAYVFFDPQCPHCAALWVSARPLKSQARFVWLPVALLNDKSEPQGAAILAAPDPVAAMDQHEASLTQHQGGISGMGAPADKREAVKRNTALLNRFAFSSVPTIVGKHAQTGEVVTIEGAVPTAMLAQKLGLTLPG
ncbi:MAG: dsbG [Ramlibacter sp.]|nr:dsbG [Ramlibacter sp.]